MSSQNQKQKSNNEQKKKRRTRKDQQGRNFTCPCGKSYLSYPALYTHIKTKHQGKAPKQDAGNAPKADLDDESETKNPLNQIKQLIDKYFPGNNSTLYPTPLSNIDNEYINEIIQSWQQIKQTKLQDPSNNMNQSINNIFARFLTQIKNQIKIQGYTYLCQFICCFHKGLQQQKNYKDYCNGNNGSQLPNYFNDFILKKKVPGYQCKKGSPVNNLTLACKILYYFGAWMFQLRYTNFSLKYNTQKN